MLPAPAIPVPGFAVLFLGECGGFLPGLGHGKTLEFQTKLLNPVTKTLHDMKAVYHDGRVGKASAGNAVHGIAEVHGYLGDPATFGLRYLPDD